MKNTMTFVSLLTLTLSATASAQMVSLPGAASITMPTAVPGQVHTLPSLIMPGPGGIMPVSLSLIPMGGSLPVLPITPVIPVHGDTPLPRISPVMPTPKVIPVMPIRYAPLSMTLSAPSKDAAAATAAAPRAAKKLDKLFDGRGEGKDAELPPVRSDRHQSLPENELEKEIGAY